MSILIAIDPGINKCGMILINPDEGIVLEGRTVHSDEVLKQIIDWQERQKLQRIVLGNGTTSERWLDLLKELAPVSLVDEFGTTLRARERYFELWPPTKWLAFLPRGLILPPMELDSIAALVLLEDHLKKKLRWVGPPPFRIGS